MARYFNASLYQGGSDSKWFVFFADQGIPTPTNHDTRVQRATLEVALQSAQKWLKPKQGVFFLLIDWGPRIKTKILKPQGSVFDMMQVRSRLYTFRPDL